MLVNMTFFFVLPGSYAVLLHNLFPNLNEQIFKFHRCMYNNKEDPPLPNPHATEIYFYLYYSNISIFHHSMLPSQNMLT